MAGTATPIPLAAAARAAVVLWVALTMPVSSDEPMTHADAPLIPGKISRELRPPDAESGRAIYRRRCARCHSPDLNGDGPMHRGVLGRKAASVPGFNYSTALRASGLTWDEATLDRWLADPETLVPGQAMDLQVSNPQARRDLIAYLKSVHD